MPSTRGDCVYIPYLSSLNLTACIVALSMGTNDLDWILTKGVIYVSIMVHVLIQYNKIAIVKSPIHTDPRKKPIELSSIKLLQFYHGTLKLVL